MSQAVALPQPEGEELSLAELAVLDMTNDPEIERGAPIVLTTKDSYAWAAAVALSLERFPGLAPEDFRARYSYAVQNLHGPLQQLYREALPWRTRPFQEHLAYDMFGSVVGSFGVSQEIAFATAEQAYGSLSGRELVEDPFDLLVGGAPLMVLGLVPFSFTRKTQNGKTLSLKMSALFWSYEQSHVKGTEKQQLQFKLLKILRAFRSGAVESFKAAIE